jgi:hypothetical protein
VSPEAIRRREAWFREHVDSQPPLTKEEREKLRAILGKPRKRAQDSGAADDLASAA